ncbi:adenosine kinase [Babesia ovis]|uniref:Adenosine kinase n=1 Tax=Babesia ovis TaxID=5869 RepID=A0A9W5T904_BABOV|nr:adenosine kinase [Babesia ovis]
MGDTILEKGPLSVLFVGHPMIDMFARVESSVVEVMGVPKGESSIVDIKAFDKLSQMVTVEAASPGCSAANSAFAYAYLGGKASYFGIVGCDEQADVFDKHMGSDGLDMMTIRKNGDLTSKLYSLVTPDAERTMYLLIGASHTLKVGDLDPAVMDRFDFYSVNGFMFASEEQTDFTHQMVDAALSRGKGIITLLANSFCVRRNGKYLKPVVDKSAYVSGNIEEFSILFDIKDKAALCDYIAKRTTGDKPTHKAVIMTMNAEGAIIFYQGKQFYVPPTGANVVDTTGAGDFFAGSVLYGLLNGWSVKKASQFALTVVFDVISHVGTYLSADVRAKIEALKAEP